MSNTTNPSEIKPGLLSKELQTYDSSQVLTAAPADRPPDDLLQQSSSDCTSLKKSISLVIHLKHQNDRSRFCLFPMGENFIRKLNRAKQHLTLELFELFLKSTPVNSDVTDSAAIRNFICLNSVFIALDSKWPEMLRLQQDADHFQSNKNVSIITEAVEDCR